MRWVERPVTSDLRVIGQLTADVMTESDSSSWPESQFNVPSWFSWEMMKEMVTRLAIFGLKVAIKLFSFHLILHVNGLCKNYEIKNEMDKQM